MEEIRGGFLGLNCILCLWSTILFLLLIFVGLALIGSFAIKAGKYPLDDATRKAIKKTTGVMPTKEETITGS